MRNAPLALLAMIALLTLPVTQAATTAAGRAPRTVAPDFAAIDAYVTAQMKDARIPGVALAIVQGDQIVHLRGFGKADPAGHTVTPQTPFNIGSTSKAITALAVMQLVEAGKLELDAPVQRYLPWFRVADADASARITVRHLLTHTSGLPEAAGNEYRGIDDSRASALEDRVRALSVWSINRPVGARFEYCSANYDTLGLIVQTAGGRTYEHYVQQHVFAPLEMQHAFTSPADALPQGLATGYRSWFGYPVPFNAPYPRAHLPSGYLIASAEDLAHFAIAHLNEGRYGVVSVLSAAGISEMLRPAVTAERQGSFYGMSWRPGRRSDVATLGVGGDNANFKSRLLLAPEAGWGIVVLINMQSVVVNSRRLELHDGVLSLLVGQQPAVSQPHHQQGFPTLIVVMVGTVLMALAMIRSAVVLRRWYVGAEQRPYRRRGVVRHVVLPLVLFLGWALLLLVGLPYGARRSLSFMMHYTPDLGYVTVISGALALGWGIVRTGLALVALRRARPPA